MADLLKPAFRATSGLDAAGEKVINVAKADYAVLDDGVNVEFFIEENTLQQYDETRAYKTNFAVIFDNRIWVANRDIPAPAGAFVETYWKAVRTDPKWAEITNTVYNLKSGDYVTINSSTRACEMSLPQYPQDGDTIVIKDIGDNAGYNKLNIKATNQLIVRHGAQVPEALLTKRQSYNILVYSNRLWQFYETAQEEIGIRVEPSSGEFKTLAGDYIMRRYTTAAPIKIILPKYANQGDIVRVADIDGLGPTYHFIVKTFDQTSSLGQAGVYEKEFRTKGSGFFTYNKASATWVVHEGDLRTRLRIIQDNVKLQPNESVMVFGANNSTVQTIEIELPTDVAIGDICKIALNYMRKNQTVKLKVAAGSTDKIATDIKLLQFPKRSEYPPETTWVAVDSLTFNGDINYTPVIELSYFEDSVTKAGQWLVAQNVPTVERVDSKDVNTRARLGVIALATQNQANVDRENNPEKELAITPETLANRVAKEDQRGIARIATTAQVNQVTEFDFVDDVIITPKKLNAKQATETMRGVAETATQVETNAGTDDARIVTPKKLNDRKASETLTGILALTGTGATTKPNTVRGATDGVNVYKTDENTKAITPKSLFENKATATAQGGVYLAIQSEVDTGQTQAGYPNSVVTPETLHARRATDANHGLIEIATQQETDAGTDYTRAVTPKTLNDRKASMTLTGIARIATQTEFNDGTLDNVISTPLKVKTRFNDPARTSVSTESGLVETGTLWDHYTLDIQEASETQRGTLMLATQSLTDLGADDKTAVTPLKLQKKKATENAEGIVQFATQDEVIAGVVANKAFSPKHFKFVVQSETVTDWAASPSLRGFVKLTEGPLTWTGDNVKGSVDNLATFQKVGYAVSPFELNTALSHYLPIGAKAVDSDKLDGLDSLQFIRRDIAQDVNGIITFKKDTLLEAPLLSTSTADFDGTLEANGITTTNGNFAIKNGTNSWKATAGLNGTTLVFGDTTNVLTLNNANGNVAVQSGISAGTTVSAKTAYNLNSREIITTNATSLVIGDSSAGLSVRSKDAANILAVDGDTGQNYKVLTEKNVKTIVDQNFVKKEGDTMGGKLTVEAPVLPRIPEALAVAPLTTANIGFWASEIKTPAIYEKLPGYAIPVMEMKDGVSTGFVEHYEYQVAPGLMTCFGTSIDYIYRTWSPRPIAVKDNHNANTQYISIWDAARGEWGEWGRVYTKQAPPTASEIGAVSSAGSAFNNLTIRDWLQIGNVRIEPDETTQTVKFTWIP